MVKKRSSKQKHTRLTALALAAVVLGVAFAGLAFDNTELLKGSFNTKLFQNQSSEAYTMKAKSGAAKYKSVDSTAVKAGSSVARSGECSNLTGPSGTYELCRGRTLVHTDATGSPGMSVYLYRVNPDSSMEIMVRGGGVEFERFRVRENETRLIGNTGTVGHLYMVRNTGVVRDDVGRIQVAFCGYSLLSEDSRAEYPLCEDDAVHKESRDEFFLTVEEIYEDSIDLRVAYRPAPESSRTASSARLEVGESYTWDHRNPENYATFERFDEFKRAVVSVTFGEREEVGTVVRLINVDTPRASNSHKSVQFVGYGHHNAAAIHLMSVYVKESGLKVARLEVSDATRDDTTVDVSEGEVFELVADDGSFTHTVEVKYIDDYSLVDLEIR